MFKYSISILLPLMCRPYREDVASHITHQPLFMPPRTTAKHFPITDSRPSLIKCFWQVQFHSLKLLNQRCCCCQTQIAMALIGNLTGLWLVALLAIQSANMGGWSFCIRYLHTFFFYNQCDDDFFASLLETLCNKQDIPFPLPSPTRENLDDICCQGHGRPRYPESFYPRSGRSYLRRRGKAINRLESWYAFCCSDQLAKENDLLVFCCAQQAVSVHLFLCVCVGNYNTKYGIGDTEFPVLKKKKEKNKKMIPCQKTKT